MANKNKVLPYIIFGVPIAIGLYFVYKAVRNAIKRGKDAPDSLGKDEDSKVVKTKTASGKTSTKSAIAEYFPLKKGSKGAKVTELQKAILKYDSTLLGKYGADGDFGKITETALQSILGKTSADSQDDINEVIKKADDKVKTAATTKAVADSNQQRIALANKLLDALSLDKSLDFRALHDTQVKEFELTTDGREKNNKSFIYHQGQKIETSGYTKEFVSPDGNIKLYVGNKVYFFSPYGFELY